LITQNVNDNQSDIMESPLKTGLTPESCVSICGWKTQRSAQIVFHGWH